MFMFKFKNIIKILPIIRLEFSSNNKNNFFSTDINFDENFHNSGIPVINDDQNSNTAVIPKINADENSNTAVIPKINADENPDQMITFSIEIGKKKITLERNANWEFNVTQTSKLFGKRWRDWKTRNSETIEVWEKLEGRPLVREIGPKNKKQTLLDFLLTLRMLSDYDSVLEYHIFKSYQQDLLKNFNEKKMELEHYKQKLEIANAKIAKLKKKPLDVDLGGGKFLLYAYSCNKKTKFGHSFCNKNGQRPKSHKTSVPNLAIGFVIYSSKETLQALNKVIKQKFNIQSKKEHLDCTIDELKTFVISYLKLMG